MKHYRNFFYTVECLTIMGSVCSATKLSGLMGIGKNEDHKLVKSDGGQGGY